jgi:protein-serine/threonine kinase
VPPVLTQLETAAGELISPATSQKPLSSSSPPSLSSSSRLSATNPPQTSAPSKWFSLEGLKELTRGVIFKSGPPTPTRALSAAHSSQSDGRDTPSRISNDGTETPSGTQTPRTTGAQPPAQKGKLTIKIVEARGLRKCRDPYVVAVFQRSELISGGPRAIEEEETLSATPSGLGGIPIQRQGSDSGRPPMAIPMRSRQSSNTSIHDYNTFRNRTIRVPSSNPKWDAEAVLYVHFFLLSHLYWWFLATGRFGT